MMLLLVLLVLGLVVMLAIRGAYGIWREQHEYDRDKERFRRRLGLADTAPPRRG